MTDDAASLAALRALAAVADPELADEATEVADGIARGDVPEPAWAAEVGRPAFARCWMLRDPFDDQIGYYAHFRYEGRPEHLITALYDENLGAIVKDASVGELARDPRATAEASPGVTVSDVDPGELSARVRSAIASGDLFLDNDWTQDFVELRALLAARMRLLPRVALPELIEPIDDEAREALIEEFLTTPDAPPDGEVTPEFRSRATDPSTFGPAKAMTSAMLADGVELTDPQAVQDWIDGFNARPFEERDAFLSRFDPT